MPTVEPTKAIKTVCPYCGVGCGMVLQIAENRVVGVSGDKDHPANFGRLCTKGLTCGATLNSPDRAVFAHARPNRESELQQVPLTEALLQTASRLRALSEKHGPDAIALYVSGQISMEAQYLANKLCKGFLGTNNIDSNSRLCMSSAASGYKLSLGADAPPGSYRDIEASNCFFVIGANMADCHPILFLRVLDRRKTSGAKLIVVDPRRTPTAEKADLFLQLRPGTDLALLNGLLHLLVQSGHIDNNFIAAHTEDWETVRFLVSEYTPQHVAHITGLSEEDLQTAAQWIGEAEAWMSFWTMGLNQSTHGTWHTNALCNLHLATGKICQPGSGPFSLTGQPNAMGGREVGYLSHGLPGQRSVTQDKDRAFIEKLWGLPPGTIGASPGLDAVSMFKKLEAGELKGIWIIGTNPVATLPNRDRVIRGLKKAELVIVQDAYHPTETSRFADILLPGALWAEADGTMTNSERTITLMERAINPAGDVLPDWELIARVARHLGFDSAFSYESPSGVFDEIRQTWNPETGYDLRGITYDRLREQPLQWPCSTLKCKGESIRYLNRTMDVEASARDGGHDPGRNIRVSKDGGLSPVFPTATGKARFLARPYITAAELPNEEYPFVLMTGRVAHQWHTRTKTGKVAALNKLNPGPFLELHPEDCRLLGLEERDLVQVRSRRGAFRFPALPTNRVRPGSCFAPFHWNDLFGENLAVNAATSEAVDLISLQPELKFCAVHLEKIASQKNGCGKSDERAHEESSFMPQPEFQEFSALQKAYLLGFAGELGPPPGETFRGSLAFDESTPFTVAQQIWLRSLLVQALNQESHFDGTHSLSS